MPAPSPNGQPTFELSHDSFGRLVLAAADGQTHVGVEPVRCFPLSDREHYIALCDSHGRELALIADVADLPPATREFLLQDLARREFSPRISRITSRVTAADWSEWQVETDRGPTRLRIKSEDDVRRLDADRVLVIDAQGIRYLVENTRQLDGASRAILDHYL
ncbi:MAG: DUF1854 domain-containing protein [Pirellulales bacterium]